MARTNDSRLTLLTEVVVRPQDTLETLKQKVKYATILGTLQATLTDFRYLRKIWKNNCEEERLLGVSLTGIMDHEVMSGGHGIYDDKSFFHSEKNVVYDLETVLTELRQVAKETNEEWAKKLGINKATAITTVKPSGTVSQLVNSSSGIHPRQYPYYLRTVMSDSKDPMAEFLVDEGVPHNKDQNNYYFQFPIKAPDSSVSSADITAIKQLDLWKVYADHWCDHNPSQTIYYTDDDYFEVGSWVWKNFDKIGGVSFFPKSDHVIPNTPYKEITEEEFNKLDSEFPKINWENFKEDYDGTTGSQEYACAGGSCDI